MKHNRIMKIAMTGIGSLLFFVLGEFVSIPSGITNTYISLQYGLLAFSATVFGPVVGFITGLTGHFFIDFVAGEGISWSWIITSAIFGCVMGLYSLKFNLAKNEFGKTGIIMFNIGQLIVHLILWALLAPVLDMIMYRESAHEVFKQGIICAGVNIVTTSVVGTLLCISYATYGLGKENDS